MHLWDDVGDLEPCRCRDAQRPYLIRRGTSIVLNVQLTKKQAGKITLPAYL